MDQLQVGDLRTCRLVVMDGCKDVLRIGHGFGDRVDLCAIAIPCDDVAIQLNAQHGVRID